MSTHEGEMGTHRTTRLVAVKAMEGLPYGILQEGSLKYIVDKNRKKLTHGYHDFEIQPQKIDHREMHLIVGKLGSMSTLLQLPREEGGMFRESATKAHAFKFDEALGMLTSSTGAMTYIVDPETGGEISRGYHSIYKSGDSLYGKTGSRTEKITLALRQPKNKYDELEYRCDRLLQCR